ncbi:exonuclease domain-containing protein [Roseivirga sp. BDSF3-8]|uniref:exonuclease domain-containing protein n=1 Tax=Roseivirga sp. BDSF3-8 TaxID=3241598 RepID=UPI003531E123
MHLNLKNPLVFFDLETTGTNISKDRIVELSFLKVLPNQQTESKTMRLNPTIPIPHETSLIHGIYDEDIKDKPTFKQVAKDIAKFLEGADLSGYNIVKFDVPMLVEEFLRVDVDFNVSNRKLVDSQKIFHMMEKRNLSAALKFYCNKSLNDAHSAEADTIASYEVLKAQIERYNNEDVTDLKGNKVGRIENNMDMLHQLTCSNMVDLAGRIVRNEKQIECFNFGKHRGRPVVDVLDTEPGYYDWMMRGDFPLDTKRHLTIIKLKSFKR